MSYRPEHLPFQDTTYPEPSHRVAIFHVDNRDVLTRNEWCYVLRFYRRMRTAFEMTRRDANILTMGVAIGVPSGDLMMRSLYDRDEIWSLP